MRAWCLSCLTVVQWQSERGPGDRGAVHSRVGDWACVRDICGASAVLKLQPFRGSCMLGPLSMLSTYV